MKKFFRLSLSRSVLPGLVVALVLLTAGSQSGLANTITLMSSGGGVYDYGLALGPGESVLFNQGDGITLSGLSGVTGASVSGLLSPFTVSTFTPTSVVFALLPPHISTLITNTSLVSPETGGTLEVYSSVLTTGMIDFSIVSSSGTVTGTTQGPVAAPEPGSLALLAAGLLGLAGLSGYKKLHAAS